MPCGGAEWRTALLVVRPCACSTSGIAESVPTRAAAAAPQLRSGPWPRERCHDGRVHHGRRCRSAVEDRRRSVQVRLALPCRRAKRLLHRLRVGPAIVATERHRTVDDCGDGRRQVRHERRHRRQRGRHREKELLVRRLRGARAQLAAAAPAPTAAAALRRPTLAVAAAAGASSTAAGRPSRAAGPAMTVSAVATPARVRPTATASATPASAPDATGGLSLAGGARGTAYRR